jgi:hypothetical protein
VYNAVNRMFRTFFLDSDSDSGLGPELTWLFPQRDELLPITPKMPATGSQLASVPAYEGITDIEIWLTLLENAAVQFEWTDVDTAAAAKSKLKGTASVWLQAQRKAGLLYPDFQNVAAAQAAPARLGLRQALVRRFGERITELAAADAVSQLTQKDGEPVDTFYDRVVIALDRKNFSYTVAQKLEAQYQVHFMADVYTFFGAGLLEYIRARTRGSHDPPRTADALLVAARAVESEYLRNHQKKKIVANVEVEIAAESSEKEQKEEPQSLELQVAALQRQVREMTSQQKMNLTCFRCRGKGHMANECPSPENVSSQGDHRRQQDGGVRGGAGRRPGSGRGGWRGGNRGRRGWNNNNNRGRGGNWHQRGNWGHGAPGGWRPQPFGSVPAWSVQEQEQQQYPWFQHQGN